MHLGYFLTNLRNRRWLDALDPRLKLAIVAWISTLGVVCDSTAALLTLTAIAAAFASGLRSTRRGAVLLIGTILAIAWGTVLSQAVFYAGVPRTPLVTLIQPFEWNGWNFPGLELYREGMIYGLKQSLRMISVTLVGMALCLSTSPERIFAALAKLRVPAAIGFMTVAALRMLPLLAAEYAIARQARRLRGGRDLAAAALFVPVLSSALRRATALAMSVTARGFDPMAPRTYYPRLEFNSRERVLLLVLAITWLIACGLRMVYWLHVAGYFSRPELGGLYAVLRDWL